MKKCFPVELLRKQFWVLPKGDEPMAFQYRLDALTTELWETRWWEGPYNYGSNVSHVLLTARLNNVKLHKFSESSLYLMQWGWLMLQLRVPLYPCRIKILKKKKIQTLVKKNSLSTKPRYLLRCKHLNRDPSKKKKNAKRTKNKNQNGNQRNWSTSSSILRHLNRTIRSAGGGNRRSDHWEESLRLEMMISFLLTFYRGYYMPARRYDFIFEYPKISEHIPKFSEDFWKFSEDCPKLTQTFLIIS